MSRLDGTLDGIGDGLGFVFSEGEKDILTGIHNRSNTHGDAVDGYFVEVVEETRVILAGLFGKGLDAGAGGK